MPVTQLPGFGEGLVSVQDAAAQRAAPLLLGRPLAPGARVLDACAAPGGKTAHLLELAELDLLALDRDADRLARVDDDARATRPRCRDARRRRLGSPRRGGTGGRSTRSCSMRRAARRGSCGAIPTCAGCVVRATSRPSPRRRRACSTRSGPCSRPEAGCSTARARCSSAKDQAQIDAFLQRHGDAVHRREPAFARAAAAAARQSGDRDRRLRSESRGGRLLPRAAREVPSRLASPPMTRLPPHGSLRRRSVLRALGLAASRGWPLGAVGVGRRCRFGPSARRRGGAHARSRSLATRTASSSTTPSISRSAGARRTRCPGGAALLRCRDRDVP